MRDPNILFLLFFSSAGGFFFKDFIVSFLFFFSFPSLFFFRQAGERLRMICRIFLIPGGKDFYLVSFSLFTRV